MSRGTLSARSTSRKRIGVLTALATALLVTFGMLTPTAAFAVSLGADITGTITSAQTGNPVAGIDVYAITVPGTVTTPHTNTGLDGSYTLIVAPGTDYKILIADLSAQAYAETYIGTPNLIPEEATTFHGGDTANASVYHFNQIQGQVNYVHDGATNGASGVTVTVYGADDQVVGETQASGEGQYSLFTFDVTEQTYTVKFSDPSNQVFETAWYSGQTSAATASPVHIFGGDTATLQTQIMVASPIINGFVADSNSSPLGDIPVSLVDLSGNVVASTMTNGDNFGQYQLKGLPNGTFHLRFGTPGATNWASGWWLNDLTATADDARTMAESGTVTLAPGQIVLNANDHLQASSDIKGTIYANGGMLPGAHVQLLDDADQVVANYETGGDGTYQFNGLHTGNYTVYVTAPGYIDNAVSLPLSSEGTDASGTDVTLVAPGSTHGIISDSSGVVGGAAVTLYMGASLIGQTTTDTDGSYSFGGLPATDFTIVVSKAKFVTYTSDPFSVAAGDNLEIDATIVELGKIKGTVHDSISDNGIPGVTVTLKQGATVVTTVITDSSGAYTVDGLAAGTYQAYVNTGAAGRYFEGQLSADALGVDRDVVVNDGDVITGFDASLEQGVTVSGTVTAGDQPGTPGFEGITVNLHSGVDGTVASTTVTDINGHFSFLAHAGSYSVEMVPTGEPTNIYPAQWWDTSTSSGGTSHPELASTLHAIVPGAVYNTVNVALEPYPSLLASLPHVTGTTKVGSTLTGKIGVWGPGTPTLTHGWYRSDSGSGTLIAGATGLTYKLINADAGHRITFRVTGTEVGFLTASIPSAATATVTGGTLSVHTPTISGTRAVGQHLTASAHFTSPSGTITYTYQWKRNGSSIRHATLAVYRLTSSDAGQKITVTVTGRETGFNTASKTSGSTTIQRQLTAAPIPKITGTASVGHILTASAGSWKPSPVTLHYQWYVGGTAVGGATHSTYRVLAADAGLIWVAVTGSRSGYTSVTRTSSAKTIS
jgi:hypothetical protein